MAVSVDIEKKIGNFRLRVNFESDSRMIGVLGASGCGKSMTLKCIAGIETPDTGKITVDGKVLFDSKGKISVKPQKRKVGYLFQNYALFPTMTVAQNIAAGLKGTKEQNRERVCAMVEKFQLQGLEKRLPGELSGGQQQRTALARIMAYEPDVILLDEPFSALDDFLKNRLQQEMVELLKDYRGIVIMVSHSRDEIYRLSEELLIMDKGISIQYGNTKELFENPVKKEAARLTGCKNFARLQVLDEHRAFVPEWGVKLYSKRQIPGYAAFLGYRAHDFVPVWETEEENFVQIEVMSTAELPFERQYYLKPAAGEEEAESICWFVQREKLPVLEGKKAPAGLVLLEEKMLFLEEEK